MTACVPTILSSAEGIDEKTSGKAKKLTRVGRAKTPLWLSNLEDKGKPVKLEYATRVTENVTIVNDKIYVNPFPGHREESNPFVASVRRYPVDFPLPSDVTLITKIAIPDGYEIESLPESSATILPENGGRCSFNFSRTANQVVVTSRTQINKTLFMPEEYPQLRAFYSHILAKKGEHIVLQKKLK